MPDLTIVYAYTCVSNLRWSKTVEASKARPDTWCVYHERHETPPLCKHGLPETLLGYDNGFQAAGHIWACSHQYEVEYSASVGNSGGSAWTCTCKGYYFRKHCKHIAQVASGRCGWNSALDPSAKPANVSSDPQERSENICPDCGGSVEVLRVGV